MKGKLSIVRVLLILGAAVLSGCESPEDPSTEETGLANPASVYCEEQGGTIEIRTSAEGGQYGVCIFPDGSECEEWAYYRGECTPGGQIQVTRVEIQ